MRELPALPRIVRQRIDLAHRVRRLEGAEGLPLILRKLGDHALHVLVLLARDLGTLALLLLRLQRRGPCTPATARETSLTLSPCRQVSL